MQYYFYCHFVFVSSIREVFVNPPNSCSSQYSHEIRWKLLAVDSLLREYLAELSTSYLRRLEHFVHLHFSAQALSFF